MAPLYEDQHSFIEHLEELRERILKSLVIFTIAVCIGYALAPWPIDWLTYPIVRTYEYYEKEQAVAAPFQIEVGADGALRLLNSSNLSTMQDSGEIEFYAPGTTTPMAVWHGKKSTPLFYLHPMDPFVIRLKASVFLGLLFSLPFLIYQVWAFVSPGLLKNERSFAIPLIVAGSLLFPIGAVFAYFIMDVTLRFFTQFIASYAVPFNDARAYLGFVITMMLAFGAIFELPLFVVLAIRAGLVTVSWLAERRKIIFVALLVLAALITPSGDPATLIALTLPLYFLFEVALIVGRVMEKKSQQAELAAEDPEASTP